MKITNKFNVPMSLAIWLAYDEYDHSDNPKLISATGLLKPLKSMILSMRATKTGDVDVSDLISSSMGTAIHTAIEVAWKSNKLKDSLASLGYPNKVVNNILINPKPDELTEGCIPIYMELRRDKEIDGYIISGKFDFISDGKLEDFKSTGVFNYINQSNKQKYIEQASIYRWIFPDLITQDSFVINYIFTDWSSTKAKQDKNYPQSRLLPQEYVLMSYQDTERFIKQKIKQIEAYKDAPQESIPQCTSEELWERPSVFKYYKNPEKLDRSTKNFDSYWEANQKYTEDGSVGRIIEVKGEVVFCKYCSAREICNQAKQYIQEGRLIL
jgi:hypothetical protein